MNATERISIPPDRIASFCKIWHIRKLSLFGSILNDDFGPESDVDMLVEFQLGKEPGSIRLAGAEIELSAIVGRETELRTAEDLSPYFRDEVVRDAEKVYGS